MAVIGIDPGITGGICYYSARKAVTWSMPINKVKHGSRNTSRVNAQVIRDILKKHKPDKVYIELQQARPGQSSIATATTFMNMGILIGVVTSLNIELVMVEIRDWQVVIYKDIAEELELAGKDRSFFIAESDGVSCLGKKGEKLDGIADAYCIAKFGYAHSSIVLE